MTPTKLSIAHVEQSINHVIMLKSFVYSILPVFEALTGASSPLLLKIKDVWTTAMSQIRKLTFDQACATMNYVSIKNAIDETLNEDVVYQRKPLDLRHQRTYAVRVRVQQMNLRNILKLTDRRLVSIVCLMSHAKRTKNRVLMLPSLCRGFLVGVRVIML